jgi:hypothetical protein
MLILTRKIDEAIRVGEDIRIVLVQIKGGQVRLGIECPPMFVSFVKNCTKPSAKKTSMPCRQILRICRHSQPGDHENKQCSKKFSHLFSIYTLPQRP